MGKEKKIKKMQVDPPEKWHKRPILTSVNGKCDCEKENPWSERDLIELEWMFRK